MQAGTGRAFVDVDVAGRPRVTGRAHAVVTCLVADARAVVPARMAVTHVGHLLARATRQTIGAKTLEGVPLWAFSNVDAEPSISTRIAVTTILFFTIWTDKAITAFARVLQLVLS